jgi:hypothetical protein
LPVEADICGFGTRLWMEMASRMGSLAVRCGGKVAVVRFKYAGK